MHGRALAPSNIAHGKRDYEDEDGISRRSGCPVRIEEQYTSDWTGNDWGV